MTAAERRLVRFFDRSPNGWGPRDFVVDYPLLIAGLVARDLNVRVTRLPSSVCNAALKQNIVRWGNESWEHAYLKAAALAWMRGEGATDAEAERYSVATLTDAYSAATNWVVECGNTRFGKLAQCVRSDVPVRFTLIPYQRIHLTEDRARRLFALDFEWTLGLTRDLQAEQAEPSERIAAALASFGKSSAAPSSIGRAS